MFLSRPSQPDRTVFQGSQYVGGHHSLDHPNDVRATETLLYMTRLCLTWFAEKPVYDISKKSSHSDIEK